MSSSAEGVVGKAATFTGVIRPDLINIVLLNDNFEPLPNIKCQVEFSDGQKVEATSDAEGFLRIPRKAQGKIKIKLLEEMKPEELKKVEKASGSVTVPGEASALTPLPAPCRNEVIVWKNVMKEVANILNQSDSMTRIWSPGKVKISETELPSLSGDLGLTGRSIHDPKNRDLVGLQFAWSKIKSRFELASIISHEYMHAKQVLSRRFTLGEAAPFLLLRQYIVLKWAAEYEAFDFQALVLKEMVKTMPEFEPCAKAILANDERLRLLTEGKFDDARKEIVNSYDVWKLSDQHTKESKVSPEERKAMEDIKNNVDKILKSGYYEKEEKTWSSFSLLP